MTFEEAVEAMNHSKVVRRKDSIAGFTYKFDKYGMLHCLKNGDEVPVYLSVYCLQADDWEVEE